MFCVHHSKHCTGRYRDIREDQVDQERTGGAQSTKIYKRWGSPGKKQRWQLLSLDWHEWRRSVAQCVQLDAEWTKVQGQGGFSAERYVSLLSVKKNVWYENVTNVICMKTCTNGISTSIMLSLVSVCLLFLLCEIGVVVKCSGWHDRFCCTIVQCTEQSTIFECKISAILLLLMCIIVVTIIYYCVMFLPLVRRFC